MEVEARADYSPELYLTHLHEYQSEITRFVEGTRNTYYHGRAYWLSLVLPKFNLNARIQQIITPYSYDINLTNISWERFNLFCSQVLPLPSNSVRSITLGNIEQFAAQQRTTRPRERRTVNTDIRLTEAKKNYFDERLDLEDYQATLRSLSYRYVVVLDHDSNSKEDHECEPKI
ncbi:unnamed protein product [Didymodactylos carnosus]|uniref:Uncharacterized protein n=1 Tax=Didymodactylos carnosus TaxID=1234261 RepID=A0A8S2DN97_9BILA|nr:unnamed protein product [Didymodactylos carnosus]CAF3783155.1 unnamed protein product [Didymodactylos carnosus]